MSICIGFGATERTCKNEAAPNELWCAACNATRIAHLTRRFEEMESHMKRRSAT